VSGGLGVGSCGPAFLREFVERGVGVEPQFEAVPGDDGAPAEAPHGYGTDGDEFPDEVLGALEGVGDFGGGADEVAVAAVGTDLAAAGHGRALKKKRP
jgi:hypothetical protein